MEARRVVELLVEIAARSVEIAAGSVVVIAKSVVIIARSVEIGAGSRLAAPDEPADLAVAKLGLGLGLG